FFFQAEDGIRDFHVTGVQTCALPISSAHFDAKELRRLDRFSEFFIVAARQAIAHAGLEFTTDEELASRAGVMVGAGFGGMGAFRSEERRVGKGCRSRS